MSRHGDVVSRKVLRDLATGTSKGKALVRFRQVDAAMAAMKAISAHGAFNCRNVRAEWAHSDHDNALRDDEAAKRKKLFMRNIPGDVSRDEISKVAAQHGEVESVTVRWDREVAGQQQAFIVYKREGCAAKACQDLQNWRGFSRCGDRGIMTTLALTKAERQRSMPSPQLAPQLKDFSVPAAPVGQFVVAAPPGRKAGDLEPSNHVFAVRPLPAMAATINEPREGSDHGEGSLQDGNAAFVTKIREKQALDNCLEVQPQPPHDVVRPHRAALHPTKIESKKEGSKDGRHLIQSSERFGAV